jgi:hypothetical protein
MNRITMQPRWHGLRNSVCRVSLCACLACAAAGSVQAADAAPAPGAPISLGSAEVSFRNPAKFTEMEINPNERTDWLDELSRYVARHASGGLPADERLSVTVTDVQLAGRLERRRRGDVRIVRDTSPPRIDLSFRLESAQGVTLKEGERQLRDIGFLTGSLRHRGEALAHEKGLIDAWLRQEFGPAGGR